MTIKNYISHDYPIFEVSDSVEEVFKITRNFGYSHIFIVEKQFYLGALSLSFIEEISNIQLKKFEAQYEKFAILEDENMLDSVKLFHGYNANIVPIIDKKGLYLGYISVEDLFCELSKYPLFSESGAVLSIQTNTKQYSFAEIAQIVESNNAKVFGCFIHAINGDNLILTLKISHQNLASIDESLERHGYTVIHQHYNNKKEELLKDRIGFLQKFLDL